MPPKNHLRNLLKMDLLSPGSKDIRTEFPQERPGNQYSENFQVIHDAFYEISAHVR